jgi:hypothetical protein
MPCSHVASPTHVPPLEQSPSISIKPAGGGAHVPATHALLAQSEAKPHG